MSGDLKGLRETFAFLDAFPAKIQKGAIRAGLTAAAKPVRDQARQNIESKSGTTARAVRTGSPRINQDGTVSIRIRMAGKNSFIGRLLEYGVRPHLITAGDSKYDVRTLNKRAGRGGGLEQRDNGLIKVSGYEYEKVVHTRDGVEHRTLVIDKHFVGGAILHPGFAPKPFLRPALDTRAGDAVNAMGERMRRYLKDKTGFTAPVTLTDVDDPEG